MAAVKQPQGIADRAAARIIMAGVQRENVLADHFDIDPSDLRLALSPKIITGELARFRDGGGFWSYRRVDPCGQSVSLEDGEAPHDAEPPVICPPPEEPAQPSPAASSAKILTPVSAPAHRELRFALWSDGALQIECGDDVLATLTTNETRALLTYLDRMAVRE